MAGQTFLIAPENADASNFPARLESVLASISPAALLLPVGERNQADYSALVRAAVPIAQSRGVAVLLENHFDLVASLGADGVHMTTGIKALEQAISVLKPDFIVGTGKIGSRHEAMVRGELDIDYLMFGDREGSDAALADWWAETFEVPSVYRAKGLDDPAIKTIGTEFIAFAGDLWTGQARLADIEGARS